MEILFKICISLIVIILLYYQLIFLKGVWTSQLDPKATVERLLEKFKPDTNVVVTRDPSKIYQNGNAFGEVYGEVTILKEGVIFEKILNATGLDQNLPIEYQRYKLKIKTIASTTGLEVNMTDNGTIQSRDVLTNVVCDFIE